MLIQELMKRTHKLGATQRAALEFRVKDEDEQDQVSNEVLQNGFFRAATVATAATKFTRKAERDAPTPPSQSTASWNILQWCTGGDRTKPTPAVPFKAVDEVEIAAAKENLPEDSPPPPVQRQQLDLMWDAIDLPPPPLHADKKHMSAWQADRIGSRERVVEFSFVRWFDGTGRRQEDAFNHVLVLTSEKYMLFKVLNPADAEHAKRWVAVWRRPYRALVRLAVGVGRIHFLHRSADNQQEQNSTLVTALFPSRTAAKSVAACFWKLNRAWRSVERALNPALKVKPLRFVENGAGETFRKLNFTIQVEGKRDRFQKSKDASTNFFCEPVHICKKNGAWEAVLLVFQQDALHFAKKDWSQIAFEQLIATDPLSSPTNGPPLTVMFKYELQALAKIKYEVRVEDFDRADDRGLCPSLVTPFPALVLRIGEEELAIAFARSVSNGMEATFVTVNFFIIRCKS